MKKEKTTKFVWKRAKENVEDTDMKKFSKNLYPKGDIENSQLDPSEEDI